MNSMTRGQAYEHVCIGCERFGMSVTSAFRSLKRNQEAGGHPLSKHRTGEAWDLVLDTPSRENLDRVVAWFIHRGFTVKNYWVDGQRTPGKPDLHVQSIPVGGG